MPQLRSTMAAIGRKRKEFREMWVGSETKSDDITTAVEQRFNAMKQKTGKTKFDIRELI